MESDVRRSLEWMFISVMFIRNAPTYIHAIIITGLLFVAFYIYGKSHFYRDPGSIFFDPARWLERKYSLYREEEAVAFRNAAFYALHKDTKGFDRSQIWKAGESPSITAVVVTIGRAVGHGPHPLENTLTSALSSLTKVEREDMDLRVYFADREPETQHPLWTSWMMELVDNTTTPHMMLSKDKLDQINTWQKELGKDNNQVRKVAHDFSYALQYAYATSSTPYIALFEGDILLADGWFARTRLGVQAVERIAAKLGVKWLDLRLFNDDKNIGWGTTNVLESGSPKLVLLAPVSLSLAATLMLLRKLTKVGRKHLTIPLIMVVCIFTVPGCLILFFRAGSSSMVPHTSIVSVQRGGCCTQGVIMPREQVPALIEQLRNRHTPPDITFIDYPLESNLWRFRLNPIQIQHMGFKSTLDPTRSDKDTVWSTGFESLKPNKLEREHRAMVLKLYGTKENAKWLFL